MFCDDLSRVKEIENKMAFSLFSLDVLTFGFLLVDNSCLFLRVSETRVLCSLISSTLLFEQWLEHYFNKGEKMRQGMNKLMTYYAVAEGYNDNG